MRGELNAKLSAGCVHSTGSVHGLRRSRVRGRNSMGQTMLTTIGTWTRHRSWRRVLRALLRSSGERRDIWSYDSKRSLTILPRGGHNREEAFLKLRSYHLLLLSKVHQHWLKNNSRHWRGLALHISKLCVEGVVMLGNKTGNRPVAQGILVWRYVFRACVLSTSFSAGSLPVAPAGSLHHLLLELYVSWSGQRDVDWSDG